MVGLRETGNCWTWCYNSREGNGWLGREWMLAHVFKGSPVAGDFKVKQMSMYMGDGNWVDKDTI